MRPTPHVKVTVAACLDCPFYVMDAFGQDVCMHPSRPDAEPTAPVSDGRLRLPDCPLERLPVLVTT